jgi:lactate dehydrogenase-like 2-hydroxyacid dehydrogenase
MSTVSASSAARSVVGLSWRLPAKSASATATFAPGAGLRGRLPLASRFSGRRLGIFGLGGIGTAVARRAAGFDLEIDYRNRRKRSDVPCEYHGDLTALAPHVAGSTQETWNEASALLVRNIDHCFTTGRPLTPVAL